jgi:hypothetical protein
MNILDMKRKLLPLGGYMGGGGDSGGGGGSSTSTSYNTNIPEYARPYVETMLGSAQQELFEYGPSDAVYEDVPIYAEQGFFDARSGRKPEKVQIGTERKLVSGSGEMVPKGLKAYKPFNEDPSKYFAGPSDLQKGARLAVGQMNINPETSQAAGLAYGAGQQALGTDYTTGQFSNQFQAPAQYQPGQFNMERVQAPSLQNYQMTGPADVAAQNVNAGTIGAAQTGYNPNLQNYQMGPAERVSTQSFAQPGSAEAYMSPYMQSVVGIQQREAQRQADIAGTQRGAQAAKTGAFGGSRQAIMDAEAARNLAMQKGDIQAQGLQSAFGQAQQQFNAEQQARLQAQQANQQAGLTVGGQNLQANLGVQQLGAGQIGLQTNLANLSNQQQANVQNEANRLQASGMNAQQALQAALANQQMGYNVGSQNLQANLGVQQLGSGQNMQAQLANQAVNQQTQQAREQSRQFGAGQDMTAAQQKAQYGLAAQQATEASRQFGANLGMQGIQNAVGAAGQLGTIGQNIYGQQTGILNLANQMGGQQQQEEQNILNQQIQNYATAQQYPMMQLSNMSNLLRGMPMQSTTVQGYQAQPNAMSQLGGLGLTAAGISGLGKAKGGRVKEKKRPAGLAELALMKMQ